MKTDKIVIVGGGSAGWMTAASLCSAFPEKEITVIESPDVPTVGVGESTLPTINMWLKSCGIPKNAFVKDTDASLKLSIEFVDWSGKDTGGFHFPFGGADTNGTQFGIHEWFLNKAFDDSIPNSDFAKTFNPAVHMCESGTIDVERKFNNWDYEMDTAYHLDAVKFANWLRDKFCKPRGVNHIQAHVNEDIKTNQDGIAYIELENDVRVYADLYIDCTGFKSLLLEKALGVEFEDYSHILPNDRAWAVQVPYTNKELELEGSTTCTAIENGWVWNTPLWSRIGTGYVYSSKYVSDKDALQEFKNFLINGRRYPVPKQVVDSLKFRKLEMRTGIHKELFHKNVVAIGLSAGFIEPLESNGLFSVHEFLHILVRTLSRKTIGYFDKLSFNTYTSAIFNEFSEFVVLHYMLSQRRDTSYWKDAANRVIKQTHDEAWIRKMIKIKHTEFGFTEANGMTYISAGLDYNPITRYDIHNIKMSHLQSMLNYNTLKNKCLEMQSICEGLPSLYSHVKQLNEG